MRIYFYFLSPSYDDSYKYDYIVYMSYYSDVCSLVYRIRSTTFLKAFRQLNFFAIVVVISLVVEVGNAYGYDVNRKSAPKKGYAAWPFPVLFIIFLVNVVLAAVFSGLTIGLIGMDVVMLEIIGSAGNEPERTYAKQIMPIRLYGHQLLSTLLVGNMLSVVFVSQMVAAMAQSSELVNFILATLVVFVFGEIIPMAVCSNGTYALKIGAKSAPVISVALFIFYPVAKPLGMLLDCLVKHDVGMIYDRKELKKLVQLHCEKYAHKSGLGADEMHMILAVLDMQEAKVVDTLIPIDKAIMLDGNLPVTHELLVEIWRFGRSRVPVYIDGCRSRIIGVLYLKDLIGLSSRQRENIVRVRDLVMENPRTVVVAPDDMRLQDIFRVFLSSKSHMVFVEHIEGDSSTQDIGIRANHDTSRCVEFTPELVEEQPSILPGDILGIVTLEDMIERSINSDIFDEYDVEAEDSDMYDPSLGDSGLFIFQPPPRPMPRINFYSYAPCYTRESLTDDQKWVLAVFLMNTCVAFSTWRLSHIKYLIDTVGERTVWIGESENEGPCLYTRGESSNVFTLLLGGGIRIVVGDEGFVTEKRSFSFFGEDALLNEEGFVPDYTAVVTRSSRYFRLTRSDLIRVENYVNRVCEPTNSQQQQIDSSLRMRNFAEEDRRCMDGEELMKP